MKCLELLENGLADFTVAEPEDFKLSFMKTLTVTHELKMFLNRK